MINELFFDPELKTRVIDLISLKSEKNESYVHPAEKSINEFIFNELEKAENVFNSLSGRKEKEVDLDGLFRNIVKTY